MEDECSQKLCIMTGLCHAVVFSIICRNVIWSLHDLPRLKPACSPTGLSVNQNGWGLSRPISDVSRDVTTSRVSLTLAVDEGSCVKKFIHKIHVDILH